MMMRLWMLGTLVVMAVYSGGNMDRVVTTAAAVVVVPAAAAAVTKKMMMMMVVMEDNLTGNSMEAVVQAYFLG